MLTEVKKQLKVSLLSVKYGFMREALNKASLFSSIFFMIINNSCMIVQWIVLFSLKDNFGGYSFKEVLLLWGLAASTYGVSRFFFRKSFNLSQTIVSGALDNYIVQPKSILLSAIISECEPSALGDIIFGYIMYFMYGFKIHTFILFTLFTITGGLMIVAVAVILGSLSFWLTNSDQIADVGNSLVTNFATYPDGIFKGVARMMLYTIIPVGITNFIPSRAIISFNPTLLLINIGATILFILTAFAIFYRGLRRYSSSNLMNARV